MGPLFWIAFAVGRLVAGSPAVMKAAEAPEPTFKMTYLEGEPMFVRILYLEEGTRVIKVPPVPVRSPDALPIDVPTDEPQVVIFTNTAEGVQGFAVEP